MGAIGWSTGRVSSPSCCAVGRALNFQFRSFLLTISVPPRRNQADIETFTGSMVGVQDSYLVDSASSHMLVSKIKPCMSKYKQLYRETANGSLYQLSFI